MTFMNFFRLAQPRASRKQEKLGSSSAFHVLSSAQLWDWSSSAAQQDHGETASPLHGKKDKTLFP